MGRVSGLVSYSPILDLLGSCLVLPSFPDLKFLIYFGVMSLWLITCVPLLPLLWSSSSANSSFHSTSLTASIFTSGGCLASLYCMFVGTLSSLTFGALLVTEKVSMHPCLAAVLWILTDICAISGFCIALFDVTYLLYRFKAFSFIATLGCGVATIHCGLFIMYIKKYCDLLEYKSLGLLPTEESVAEEQSYQLSQLLSSTPSTPRQSSVMIPFPSTPPRHVNFLNASLLSSCGNSGSPLLAVGSRELHCGELFRVYQSFIFVPNSRNRTSLIRQMMVVLMLLTAYTAMFYLYFWWFSQGW